jgi:hypothetical protein
MGWIASILSFPAAPVRAVIKLGKILQRQAEQELHHPARTVGCWKSSKNGARESPEDEKGAQEVISTTRTAPQPVKLRTGPEGNVVAPEITQEMIAERAYHISESGEGGTDEENWLWAEAELRQGS